MNVVGSDMQINPTVAKVFCGPPSDHPPAAGRCVRLPGRFRPALGVVDCGELALDLLDRVE